MNKLGFAYDILESCALLGQNKRARHVPLLLFNCMESVANSVAPQEMKYDRERFLWWINQFLDLSLLKSSPIDLWGARAAIVHKYSPYSKLSQTNEARPLYFYWGDANREILEKVCAKDERRPIPVKIEHLYEVTEKALDSVVSDLESNECMRRLYDERLQKVFSEIDSKGNTLF